MNINNIRNFVIIAHIDHGKSTLADRMLEVTGTVAKDKMHPQMLDTMELEQERGITIKLQPVTMKYDLNDVKGIEDVKENTSSISSKSSTSSTSFTLNLIDTPGHVDFSYEVSRSLAAVEGAVLVVDATKGIQAQTLANLHHAVENKLVIIPVINKIDLANAEVERVEDEIIDLLHVDRNEILKVSAKTGEGVAEILNCIIEKIPAPNGGAGEEELKALIFDSVYDSYRGVIAYVRVFSGSIKAGDKIKFLATGKTAETLEVGEFKIGYIKLERMGEGEIGYIVTGAKSIDEVLVGDTISYDSPRSVSPTSGFKIPKPFVFAFIFSSSGELSPLRKSLEKLKLNDSSLSFVPENSQSFGAGFKCGFLGLLHLEIVKERLEREYNLDLVVTQPSVDYRKEMVGGKEVYEEPWVALEIITPEEYIGPVMELAQSKRGIYLDTEYLTDRAILKYEIPLSEIIVDFYDKLKSVSSGYASQNYEMIDWRAGDLVELSVIIANDNIEEFNRVVPRSRSQVEAQKLAKKLKELIPKQMFEVAVQVAVGGKILARENISAMKKDVIAKLYGGDVTRKNKLLKKQAKGKKKMKMLGRVEIPDNVFIEILKS